MIAITKTAEKKPFRVTTQPAYGRAERIHNRRPQLEVVSKIQKYGHVRYQQIEKPPFNKVQQRIYAEAIYGLTLFSQDELAALPNRKRYDIIQRFKSAQSILNQWKQEIADEQVNRLFEKLFPKSPITKIFKSIKGSDQSLKCRLTFKELGINQQMIAQKLIDAGILPPDFYQLT